MPQPIPSNRDQYRLIGFAVLLVCLPMFAAAAAAQTSAPQRFTDPAEIDRAVSAFTGAAIGEVGGARMPADRRLRLAHCPQPLALDWHGNARSTVQIACAGPTPWRIFVSVRPAERGETAAPQVSRGDPITVVVRGSGFSVQQSGEALEDGRIGDWIAIRVGPGGRANRDTPPVRAQIERPGLAVIPTR